MNIGKFYTLIFTTILTLNSCQTDENILNQKIIGQWAIDRIEFQKQDIKDELMINFMVFEEESFSIPEVRNYTHEDADDGTKWTAESLVNSQPTIKLECKNQIFSGTYRLKFFKNYDKKLLSMIMESDSTYIIANKFFQDFDSGKNINWEK